MVRSARNLMALTLALAAAVCAVSQTPNKITPEEKDDVLKSMDNVITNMAYVPGVDFKKWEDMVKKHQSEIDKADDQAAFTGVMNKALNEFGFSHIVLFSPQAASARTNRSMVGLGVRIQPEEKGLRIALVFPGTPADEAGMQPGDLIIMGDGKPVKTTADLAGEEGSTVVVTVVRDGKNKEFKITRRKFSTDIPETIKWIDKDTAMVTIPTFDLGYKRDPVSEIMNEASKAKNLILDLRGNGGGLVLNLQHLAKYFLDSSEAIGTFINRRLASRFAEETGKNGADPVAVAGWASDKDRLRPPLGNTKFTGKIAVLIDGGTGSASEILAAALKELKGATLIGTKSAGAVLASTMMPIKHQFLLQFPLMDYVTIKGRRLEGNPLVPDKAATSPKVGEEDKAVAIAKQLFSAG